MDEGYKDMLSPDHLERLAWFEEHAGQATPWPQPLPGDRHLACAYGTGTEHDAGRRG